MILPIVAFGDPVLRKTGIDITPDHPNLAGLIQDMFDTMNNAGGVGLAAPQVGHSIRLFIVDGKPFSDEGDHPELVNFKRIFINARMLDEKGESWGFSEGCLSIPKIRETVSRLPIIRLKYMDENFKEHEEEFTGIAARIIQHEYDHIEGKLFVDRLKPLRRTLLKSRLNDISKGKVEVEYKMRFPFK